MKFLKQQPPSTNAACCTCKSQITLPEHAQVRVQILEQVGDQDETRRVRTVSGEAEVRHKTQFVYRPRTYHWGRTEQNCLTLYAQGGPLSEVIIAEREGR